MDGLTSQQHLELLRGLVVGWRYRRSATEPWTVCARRQLVYRAICQLASAAGHQPIKKG